MHAIARRLARAALAAATGLIARAAPAQCVDDTADAALGQPTLAGNAPNQPSGIPSASNLSLSNATGLAIAPDGRLYVSDPENNRILSWPRAADFATGEAADLVFGQPDFTSSAPNHGGVSANSLWLPQGLAVDEAGNLWAADAYNHRVLRYNNPATDATPLAADLVVGQHDLTRNEENLGLGGTGPDVALPDSLEYPGRVLVRGGDLYVADSGNSRVLHYALPTADKPVADAVFGQHGNFFCRAKNNDGTCVNGFSVDAGNMKNPIGLALDAAGRLYVADWANNRLLRFDDPLTRQTADAVYGQPDFSGAWYNNGGPEVGLGLPIDLACDARGTLFVADSGNSRVLAYFDPLASTLPDCVLGQLGGFSNVDFNHGLGPTTTDARGFFGPTSVAFDRAGNVYVADTNNQRVLRFIRGCGFGDLNADGRVDAGDLATWAGCAAGPAGNAPPGCPPEPFACADLDGDGDVDLADFARMQAAVEPS